MRGAEKNVELNINKKCILKKQMLRGTLPEDAGVAVTMA